MDQGLIDYINQNKLKYTKEQLVSTLLGSGYQQSSIDEAINSIYTSLEPKVQNVNTSVTVDTPQNFVIPTVAPIQVPVVTNQINPNSVLPKRKTNILPIFSKIGLFFGLGLVLVSVVMIAISFFGKTFAKGDFIGTFSAQSDSKNSMTAIEKALIKPGTYKIDKNVQLVNGNTSFSLNLTEAIVTETSIKMMLSITATSNTSSVGWLSSGAKEAKLFSKEGKEIVYLEDLSSANSKDNDLYYTAFFTKTKPTITGFALFSQPTTSTDSFTFQYPDFSKIEGIVFKK
ncbi:MAG: hypothetical protein WCK26_01035 [Candidatus Saccharibacteria bacterium]